jgi:hypothetical protein
MHFHVKLKMENGKCHFFYYGFQQWDIIPHCDSEHYHFSIDMEFLSVQDPISFKNTGYSYPV